MKNKSKKSNPSWSPGQYLNFEEISPSWSHISIINEPQPNLEAEKIIKCLRRSIEYLVKDELASLLVEDEVSSMFLADRIIEVIQSNLTSEMATENSNLRQEHNTISSTISNLKSQLSSANEALSSSESALAEQTSRAETLAGLLQEGKEKHEKEVFYV